MKNPKQYDDDDGRTIANMDVDGMPWYLRRGAARNQAARSPEQEPLQLSKEEKFEVFKGALAAMLLIIAVFVVTFFLFILFLDKVLLP